MKKEKCFCTKKKPTGEWSAGTEGSFAKCDCGGWYETTLLKDNETNVTP